MDARSRVERFPAGAAATVEELEGDPHALLARLREREPVSWLPALDGWLVTRRDLAMQVMRDPHTFTVDDPRFSTGRVVGPSMLTRDGDEHDRHREPFARPFRRDAVHARFTRLVAAETERLIDAIQPAGGAELRRSLAGPLAVAAMTRALGLQDADAATVLGWYARIVASVTAMTAGRPLDAAGRDAYAALSAAIGPALDREPGASLLAAAATDAGGLERERVISNAAVLLFGGIETTDGMIANAIWHLLSHPDQLARVRADPGLLPNAIEESLRLEPAASVVDRYATADVELAGAPVAGGELVRVSIAAANRDPAVFADPDRYDAARANARLHVAFAHGPHVCIGMHLARLEAQTAVERLLRRLPELRLDPAHPTEPRGLVFRKPPELWVLWTPRSLSPAASEGRALAFRDAAQFEAWLEEHHGLQAGVWLKLAKKGSGVPSLTSDEAVDIGLCFGWISGQRRSCDGVYYLQKYVPRRPRSRWSQVNVGQGAGVDRGRADAAVRHGRGRGGEGRRPVGGRVRAATHRPRSPGSRRRPCGEPAGGAGVRIARQDRPLRGHPEARHGPHRDRPRRPAAPSGERARSTLTTPTRRPSPARP